MTESVFAAADEGPCLFMLIGPSGSGKSTLARQARRGTVISLDTLRAAVSDDECDQEATEDAVLVLRLLVTIRMMRRLTTVIDATNLDASARTPLLSIARRHDVPAIAIVMRTPLETCLARNADRPGPAPGARWGRRVPEPVVRTQHEQLMAALPALAGEGFTDLIPVGAMDFPSLPQSFKEALGHTAPLSWTADPSRTEERSQGT